MSFSNSCIFNGWVCYLYCECRLIEGDYYSGQENMVVRNFKELLVCFYCYVVEFLDFDKFLFKGLKNI